MEYSPVRRMTPLEAMCHPYFEDFRIESKFKEITWKVRCPELYDYIREVVKSLKIGCYLCGTKKTGNCD
jgi:hypothetical protein